MGKRRSINITRIKYKDKLILDEYCLVADSPLVITEENVKKECYQKYFKEKHLYVKTV